MNQRIRFVVLLGVLFAIALGYYFFSTDRSTELVLIGTVDANQVVVSPKVAGRIVELPVEEGDNVKAGQLIATIDSEELTAARKAAAAQVESLRSQVASMRATAQSASGDTANTVASAQSNLAAARASLNEAIANRDLQQSQTDRTVQLAKQGVVSQLESDRASNALKATEARVQTARDQVNSAEAALKIAQARTANARAAQSNVGTARGQVANAEAQLAQAEARLGYTKIVAPVDGKVAVRVARPGEVVNVGQAIVTLVDLTQTWVYAPLPETQADAVQLGDHLKVRMPSGAEVEGQVIAKSAEGDFATQRDVSRRKRDIRTVQLKLRIDNPGEKYVPGMTAEVLLPKSKLVSR